VKWTEPPPCCTPFASSGPPVGALKVADNCHGPGS
jgi:hypothetical protein